MSDSYHEKLERLEEVLAEIDARSEETDKRFEELKRESAEVIARSERVRARLRKYIEVDEGPWLPLDRWLSPGWWIRRFRC